jgi:nucleoside-diphosphate-sugar epimerase
MPPQDIGRAKSDFGYAPKWDLEKGLTDWVRWYKTGKY